ncbi:MAG TPA: hypothetical protein ENI29_09890 [bacterium]|nr:hypothetical protein [bacterium]
MLTGDYQVGKTSLIKRFVENSFGKDYISTMGVQISKKTVNLTDKNIMNFIIWDIGGQSFQMAPYRSKFYSGANALMISGILGETSSFPSRINSTFPAICSE